MKDSVSEDDIKVVHCTSLQKLQAILPFSRSTKQVPTLKYLCSEYILAHNHQIQPLLAQIPSEVQDYVEVARKHLHVRSMLQPTSEIDKLLEPSSNETEFREKLLESLGITQEFLLEHQEEIFLAAKNAHECFKKIGQPFNLNDVTKLILQSSVPSKCGSECKLKIILPGTPTVTLYSNSMSLWMLPWRIKVEDKNIVLQDVYCWSVELPKLILEIFYAMINPYTREYLDGRKWWRHPIWNQFVI